MEEVCPVCGSNSYENYEGYYYCLECGTQSQEQRDEYDDGEQGAFDLSQSQQLRVRKGVKRKLDEEEEEEECNLSLHHCWQIIYQTYIKHLIINGGYDGTSLQSSAKLVWFLYLKVMYDYQLKEFNRIDTFELSCNGRNKQELSNFSIKKLWRQNFKTYKDTLPHDKHDDNNDSDDDDDDQIVNDKLNLSKVKKAVNKTEALLCRNAFVTKKVIFILAYLSLLYSGQYITLKDYINLAYNDVVPFYSWHQSCPQDVVKKLLKYHIKRSHEGNGPIVIKDVSLRIRRLKKFMELKFLPLDVTKMGNAILKKMLLPDSLQVPLRRLLYFYQENNLFITCGDYVYIDLNVMIVLLVLVKLLYRLDDQFEIMQSSCAVADSDESCSMYVWEDWVAMVTSHCSRGIQTSTNLSKYDLVKLDDPSVYLEYCKEKYFGTFNYHAKTSRKRDHYQRGESLSLIFSEYMLTRRKQVLMEDVTKQKKRPLFTLIGDKVKVITDDIMTTMRWIPIDSASLHSLGRSGDSYVTIPAADYHNVPIEELGLPSSQLFLFKFASKIISVPIADLLYRLHIAEKFICKQIGMASKVVDVYENCRSNT